jgi:hypothetical protein
MAEDGNDSGSYQKIDFGVSWVNLTAVALINNPMSY